MKPSRLGLAVALLCLAAFASSASGQRAGRPLGMALHTVQYPQADKHPFKISLELSRELQGATWNVNYLGLEPRTVALGTQLAHNAERLARHLFADVVVAQEGVSTPVEGVAAVLVPRLAYAEHSAQPVFTTSAGRPPALAIGLEWTLKSTNGATIWSETVRAELKEPFVSARTNWGKSVETLTAEWIGRVVDRAFQESYHSITSASAIAAWRPAN